jgi:hypothetical protein
MAIDQSNALWLASIYAIAGGQYLGYLVRIGPDGSVSSTTNLPAIGQGGGIAPAPCGLCADSANNIYYTGGERIYRYRTNGAVEIFAGSGDGGYVDGTGLFTAFSNPSLLAADAADNIYVWDSGNLRIRRIDQAQSVVTLAGHGAVGGYPWDQDGVGTNASFAAVYAMCVDSTGDLILACGSAYSGYNYEASCIREISASTNVATMAGSFWQIGYSNGVGASALFSGSTGVCISQGTVFVADSGNQRIREISFNPSSQPVSGPNLRLSLYPGLQITGLVGRTYQIQSSTDMQTWTLSATLLLTSSPYLWIDTNSVGTNKFYRAFLLP